MLIIIEFFIYCGIFAVFHFLSNESSWANEGRMSATRWKVRFTWWAVFLSLSLWFYLDSGLASRLFGSSPPPLILESLVSGGLFFCFIEAFWCGFLRRDYYLGSGT